MSRISHKERERILNAGAEMDMPMPETQGSLAPARGYEAVKPETISEWFRYLMETGNFGLYGSGGKEINEEIEAGFGKWKSSKAKPNNNASTPK